MMYNYLENWCDDAAFFALEAPFHFFNRTAADVWSALIPVTTFSRKCEVLILSGWSQIETWGCRT